MARFWCKFPEPNQEAVRAIRTVTIRPAVNFLRRTDRHRRSGLRRRLLGLEHSPAASPRSADDLTARWEHEAIRGHAKKFVLWPAAHHKEARGVCAQSPALFRYWQMNNGSSFGETALCACFRDSPAVRKDDCPSERTQNSGLPNHNQSFCWLSCSGHLLPSNLYKRH